MSCCGHGAYAFILLRGVRHAKCQRCGHTWLIILGTGSTDALAPNLPGIALR